MFFRRKKNELEWVEYLLPVPLTDIIIKR